MCGRKESRGGCTQWGVDIAQRLVASILKIPLIDLHCQSGNCLANSEYFFFLYVGPWILFPDVCIYFIHPYLLISVFLSLCILAEFLKFSIDTVDLIFCGVNCASYCLQCRFQFYCCLFYYLVIFSHATLVFFLFDPTFFFLSWVCFR